MGRTIIRTVIPVMAMALGAALGVGPAASAAPAGAPGGQAAITVLYDATVLATSGLQNAPNQARVLAAKAILAGARLLLNGPDPSSPGIELGGLDLYAYCQSLGDASSYTAYPGQEIPGGAYTWYCVSGTGAQTPIDLQAACIWEYPGNIAIAYPQDPDNSYSWICITPASGSYTDGATHTTVTSVKTSNSDATLITNPDSSFLTVDDNGASATVVQDSGGGGYTSYDGGNGGGVAILVYEGGNGGGVAI